mmetsp:Transcript_71704/g.203441  ORF Transcript_71704/g.203441 Transcript_71704/m.203441 type:complete len:357 (+) Transcript_71704:1611-2681(+)
MAPSPRGAARHRLHDRGAGRQQSQILLQAQRGPRVQSAHGCSGARRRHVGGGPRPAGRRSVPCRRGRPERRGVRRLLALQRRAHAVWRGALPVAAAARPGAQRARSKDAAVLQVPRRGLWGSGPAREGLRGRSCGEGAGICRPRVGARWLPRLLEGRRTRLGCPGSAVGRLQRGGFRAILCRGEPGLAGRRRAGARGLAASHPPLGRLRRQARALPRGAAADSVERLEAYAGAGGKPVSGGGHLPADVRQRQLEQARSRSVPGRLPCEDVRPRPAEGRRRRAKGSVRSRRGHPASLHIPASIWRETRLCHRGPGHVRHGGGARPRQQGALFPHLTEAQAHAAATALYNHARCAGTR